MEQLVAALAAKPAPTDQGEDGAPRRWLLLKEAARETGYSQNGLRGLVKRGVARARYRGPHMLIAVDTVPARKLG